MKTRLGFLYESFKEDCWFFEVFEFIFKLMMSSVMIHVAPGTVTQIVVAILVCFLGFAIHAIYQPYKLHSDNVVMALGKFQLFITLFAALLIKLHIPFFTTDDDFKEADLSSLAI